MIIIKVELHSAITGKVSEIGRMEIVNDGSGDSTRGNYSAVLLRRETTDTVIRRAEIKNHARLSYSVWVLVAKALAALGFEVKKGAKEPVPDPASKEAINGEVSR